MRQELSPRTFKLGAGRELIAGSEGWQQRPNVTMEESQVDAGSANTTAEPGILIRQFADPPQL
jgi:hypothetical protein